MTQDNRKKRNKKVLETIPLKPTIVNYGIDMISTLEKITEWSVRGSCPCLSISPNQLYLASCSTGGFVTIYDLLDLEPLCTLTDPNPNITEYLCCEWFDSTCLFISGKTKDRYRWDEQEDDNVVLPSDIVLIDLCGKVLLRIKAHSEEILSLKMVDMDGLNVLISTSQDGYIGKHVILDNLEVETTMISENGMGMTFNSILIPGVKNMLMVSCDDGIKIIDLETNKIFKTFSKWNSCFCDYVTCIVIDDSVKVISRGVEVLDGEDNTINTIPNTIKIHSLLVKDNDIEIELEKELQHQDYRSNSWGVRLGSNGRYLFGPTYDGNVFIFDIKSGTVAGILRDHEEVEVRDVLVHSSLPYVFTSADDGKVIVYKKSDRLMKVEIQPPVLE